VFLRLGKHRHAHPSVRASAAHLRTAPLRPAATPSSAWWFRPVAINLPTHGFTVSRCLRPCFSHRPSVPRMQKCLITDACLFHTSLAQHRHTLTHGECFGISPNTSPCRVPCPFGRVVFIRIPCSTLDARHTMRDGQFYPPRHFAAPTIKTSRSPVAFRRHRIWLPLMTSCGSFHCARLLWIPPKLELRGAATLHVGNNKYGCFAQHTT
jgi:hypothetical protein